MELQADCFAGVWGHSTAQRDILEAGDAEEGLRAASAIGDDTLQQQSSGRVRPESFTHGSAAQRVEWLQAGPADGRHQVLRHVQGRELTYKLLLLIRGARGGLMFIDSQSISAAPRAHSSPVSQDSR